MFVLTGSVPQLASCLKCYTINVYHVDGTPCLSSIAKSAKNVLIVQTYGLNELMSPQEQLALIVASMCHDLDHRGTNNSFQTKY